MSAPETRFYAVNDRPVAIVPVPGGGADCVVFDFATGELVPDRAYFEYVTPGSGKDVDALTEPEFEARLAAYRAQAGALAAARVRQWAERLCATTGPAAQVAAALGFDGTATRGDVAVDHPPAGYAAVSVRALTGAGVAIDLRPAGRLLTRAALDTEFGAGSEVPMNPEGRLLRFAYRVDVAGAPAQCAIFAGFTNAGAAAAEVMLRRDTLG